MSNDPIWPGFKFPCHVHLICKFQKDRLKIEQIMLMTKSNRGSTGIVNILLQETDNF